MFGAILGDIVGSIYEFFPSKTMKNPFPSPDGYMTDDSVLTTATAYAIMNGTPFWEAYRQFSRQFPDAGYGSRFEKWMYGDPQPYNSFGNGSAMRVSPVAYAYNTLKDVMEAAKRSAECTHNHLEGIKGAQATAAAIFFARQKMAKEEIQQRIEQMFQYDLHTPIDQIRPTYKFEVSCQNSVPQSIRCFLEGKSVEDTILLAISLGGDADTMAAIAGSIAEAYYGLDGLYIDYIQQKLPQILYTIVHDFYAKYHLFGQIRFI